MSTEKELKALQAFYLPKRLYAGSSFHIYRGGIPNIVPAMRKDSRTFAGGKTVLEEMLKALKSGDREKTAVWDVNFFDLADLCVVFENLVKIQLDSPFLTGIIGTYYTDKDTYIAINPEEARSAVSSNGWGYFEHQVKGPIKVGCIKDGRLQEENAAKALLMPYPNRISMIFTPDQFEALDVVEIKKENACPNRDMEEGEIVGNGKVINPLLAEYPSEIILPLVDLVFGYNEKLYKYNRNMGFYLPSMSKKDEARGRALVISGLCMHSRIEAWDDLGAGYNRCIGR